LIDGTQPLNGGLGRQLGKTISPLPSVRLTLIRVHLLQGQSFKVSDYYIECVYEIMAPTSEVRGKVRIN